MEMMVAAVRSDKAQQRRMAGGHIGGPVEPPKRERRRSAAPSGARRVRPVHGTRRALSRGLFALGRALEPRTEPRTACPTST